MKKLVQYTTDGGDFIFIEISEDYDKEVRRGADQSENRGIIQNARESFENALKPLKEIANSIIGCVKDIANSPSEVEVELGIKFTAKAGIILTSIDSEANLKITLKWQNNNKDVAASGNSNV